MTLSEKRRSPRVHAVPEEPTIIQHKDENIPAILSDVSYAGALVRFLSMPGMALNREYAPTEHIYVSLQDQQARFDVEARVVRQGPHFLAVEFVDSREDVLNKIRQKVRGLDGPLIAKAASPGS